MTVGSVRSMSSVRRLRPVWADASPAPDARPHQPTLEDLGTPLSDVTFVVVDLETTGGTPADCAITEIGAVKVRGGEVLGEFQTLVDPGGPVPPFIQVLTGITTTMLIGAPPIEEVLPSFLEFSRGAVLVAHNAPFDIGFLKAAAARTGPRVARQQGASTPCGWRGGWSRATRRPTTSSPRSPTCSTRP